MITLLTDFGLRDSYVGVMKGVITQIAPAAMIIDLAHQIPSQSIAAARFNLLTAFPYFPPGTIHVAVVDPGVGSKRRAIALKLEQGFLIGPDNGIFSGILEDHPAIAAIELNQPAYWRVPTPSNTFHGRDIFAPAAAHLDAGVPFEALGTPIDPDSLNRIAFRPYAEHEQGFVGCIQYIDHFGNLMTNIPGQVVGDRPWQVKIGSTLIPSHQIYGDTLIGTVLSLIGSHGWLEVAVNGGSAESTLGVRLGDLVQVILDKR